MPEVPEIAPLDLARALESGAPLQVLDIRAPHPVAGGAIAVPAPAPFLHVPGSRLFAGGDPAASGLDPGVPVAVVCGHGNSSRQVTAWLAAQGFDARSLNGGMAAWARAALPRPLPAREGFDVLVQFDRLGKGALGYLLISAGEAVVIDAPRVADLIVEEAERRGPAWVEDLWRSLERARAEWPGDLMIRPAHYASDDERAPDRSVGGRWSDVLRANEPVAITDGAAFREWVRARTREAPEAYRIIKTVNLGLAQATDAQADELEGGTNECAA